MALTVAPAKHVKMHLKNQASKIDGVMKVLTISITKTVNKCLLLIDQFKSEQKYVNSPLIKQTTSDFDITHKKLIGQLTELDQSMQKYMILSVQAATELGGGVLEQKILEQTAQMDKYSRMVKSMKENNNFNSTSTQLNSTSTQSNPIQSNFNPGWGYTITGLNTTHRHKLLTNFQAT